MECSGGLDICSSGFWMEISLGLVDMGRAELGRFRYAIFLLSGCKGFRVLESDNKDFLGLTNKTIGLWRK